MAKAKWTPPWLKKADEKPAKGSKLADKAKKKGFVPFKKKSK